MSLRTYHDPLHRDITLDSQKPAELLIINLIDSSPFQRLRRIRQLGPAFLTFHGAESSRFTHSLGVFHLARKALEKLIHLNKEFEEIKGSLYAAALLHDIGHTPLSHTGEEIFNIKHEEWSAKLILEHPEIRDLLEAYRKGTSQEISELFEKEKSPPSIMKTLVSSQIDCDRLDYLMRDSYSTGARYGQLDFERILSAFTLAPDGSLAINPKGVMAVEHYLVVRSLMYRSVYNHRLNEVCNWLLGQVIETARILGPKKVWADKYMSKWLWEPLEIDLETFLKNDDVRTCYHIQRWYEDSPMPLSELCNRYLNRNLPKAIDIGNLNSCQQLEALALARQLAQKEGHDPSYCCGLRHQKSHGYHPYKVGLRIWDGKKLQSLEQVSSLVKSLITPSASSWLIHPKEIHSEIQAKLTDMV